MAFMWTCECKALNKSRDRICALCGRERNNGTKRATMAALVPPPDPPPCTPEQNIEAAKVLREVTLRLLTIEQGIERLGQIFGPAADEIPF